MKKVFWLILLVMILAPAMVRAEDTQYFCDCTGSGVKVEGLDCAMFTSSTVRDSVCTDKKCTKKDKVPDAETETTCQAVTAAGISGTPSVTPKKNMGVVELDNPLSFPNSTNINALIGKIISGALGVMGALILLMFVWGGSTWLFSAGNPEKIKAGTNSMLYATLGALVVLISYVWLKFFFTFLSS